MASQVTREQLIALLNEDITLEYAAAIQYIQHYSVMQGAQFDAIRVHLLEHAEDEIEHATKLSDRVNYMGGVPVANQALSKTSANAVEMLQQDLHDEGVAVARYKERLEQAFLLKEYGLVEVLQGILVDEEEHENDLETTLGTQKAPSAAPAAPQGGPVDDYVPVVMAKLAALRSERARHSA